MRIGELSVLTGSSVRSLRYYEQRRLITATRSQRGQRHFGDEATARVAIIRQLLSVGLGTAAILDVLPCMAEPDTQTTALTQRLIEERNRLAAEIAHRTTMMDALDEVIRAAPSSDKAF